MMLTLASIGLPHEGAPCHRAAARAIGLLRADLLTRVTDRMPADTEIKPGELVVVDGDGFRK